MIARLKQYFRANAACSLPLVGEETRGGGDCRTTNVGVPPTPNPSPKGEGNSSGLIGACSRLMPVLACVLMLAIAITPAHAVEPGEILKDPALEARARTISQELRCVVCQNQSIDDFNAPLAHDLRVIVRERLTAGDTDSQVLAFVESRYGEFVLLRPRFKLQTLLLWLTPLLLLGGAAVFLVRARSREPASSTAPLSADEQKRLDELLAPDRSDR